MLGAVWIVVQVAMSPVGQNVHLTSPKRKTQRRHEDNQHTQYAQHVRALAHCEFGAVLQKLDAAVHTTHVRVLYDIPHSVQKNKLALRLRDLIAQGRVVFHVVIKFVALTLHHEPLLVFASAHNFAILHLKSVQVRDHNDKNSDTCNGSKHKDNEFRA